MLLYNIMAGRNLVYKSRLSLLCLCLRVLISILYCCPVGLAESAWPVSPYTLPRNLSRNLSGFASDSVFRIPQSEIRVLQVIGEGTFGEVVLAYNSVFGRVAVKWLKVLCSAFSYTSTKSSWSHSRILPSMILAIIFASRCMKQASALG